MKKIPAASWYFHDALSKYLNNSLGVLLTLLKTFKDIRSSQYQNFFKKMTLDAPFDAMTKTKSQSHTKYHFYPRVAYLIADVLLFCSFGIIECRCCNGCITLETPAQKHRMYYTTYLN